MRTVLVLATALAGCQVAPVAQIITPATPAPRACDLAGFGAAPGLTLITPKSAGGERRGKSQPLKFADKIPVNRSPADTGRWTDAGPGWKAWRYWLRSETARSVSVHIQPLALPAHAQFWLCSPDRTTRQGPILGKGLGDAGQYWSPEVAGPELWIEVLAPAGSEREVAFVIAEAFAAPP